MRNLLLIIAVFFCCVSYGQCRRTATASYISDGDTFDATVSLGYKIYHTIRIRLADMNAPEMKGKDSIIARASKAYLEGLILGKTIYFEPKERLDIYGRYIETVYLNINDTLSVNKIMIKSGYAKQQKY